MKVKPIKVISAWQFDVKTNVGQPDFVHVSTGIGGPCAIAKPPPTKADAYAPTFYMNPGEWLVQLDSGVYVHLSDHSKHYLVDMEEG